MMSPTVVRRFDLRVDQDKALDDVSDLLRKLVRQESGIDPAQIKRAEALSLLEVRLQGDSSAISRVVAQVGGWPNLRIQHDAIRVAAPAGAGLVGPGPRGALIRTGVEPGAWKAPVDPATSSASVTVAIVDSGIMVDHPELKENLWTGTVDGRQAHGARCIAGTRSRDVTDRDGHGTRLAGTILSVARGAPGVRLMAVKFFDADHLPGPGNGADGIDFAVEHHADIINLSWDLGMGSPGLARAIQAACDAGALVVIAAGNSGTNNDVIPTIPACYRKDRTERIITVMATDRYDEKASFSNYGIRTVDLAAPGVGLVATRAALTGASAVRDRLTRPFTGTSASAATVTGAAALLKLRDPSLTAEALKARLTLSASPPRGLKCIHGRLNLAEARTRY
jgi:subtilisin family serine protease